MQKAEIRYIACLGSWDLVDADTYEVVASGWHEFQTYLKALMDLCGKGLIKFTVDYRQ